MRQLLWCALALVLCGCGKPTVWSYTLASQGTNSVLDMTGVTFIFLGENLNGGSSGEATVAQPALSNPFFSFNGGTYSESGGPDGYKFETAFTNKMQVIRFRGHVVAIKDVGRKIDIDGQAFTLGSPKKTFVIPRTGKAMMRDFVPADAPTDDALAPKLIAAEPVAAEAVKTNKKSAQ